MREYLEQALSHNQLPHALLFVHGLPVAYDLAQKLLHTTTLTHHPDFHEYIPEGKSGLHAIDTLRSLIDEVYTASFGPHGKVFLIHDADRMQTASANAILKTLEEPHPDTTLILHTQHLSEILPTIRSRCVLLTETPDCITLSTLEQALFPLLSSKPSYPHLMLGIEKLEALVEDEDPVKKGQKGERVLTSYLMWMRDQYARKVSGGPLFFPEEKEVHFDLPPLDECLDKVEQARLGLQRGMRLSACLERVLYRG
jgi:hypothetical protein